MASAAPRTPPFFVWRFLILVDFVLSLFNLSLFLFSRTDNLVVFVPVFVLFWCGIWAVVRRLMFRR